MRFWGLRTTHGFGFHEHGYCCGVYFDVDRILGSILRCVWDCQLFVLSCNVGQKTLQLANGSMPGQALRTLSGSRSPLA